jgi:hypothetical protein
MSIGSGLAANPYRFRLVSNVGFHVVSLSYPALARAGRLT